MNFCFDLSIPTGIWRKEKALERMATNGKKDEQQWAKTDKKIKWLPKPLLLPLGPDAAMLCDALASSM